MASSILNSDDGVISGTSGLKSTGGDDGVLNIQNNGTTAVTVNASGNVGVGTTSPGATLTVAHASGVDGRGIRLVNSSNSQTWETRIGVEGVENTSYAIKDITAGSLRLLVDISGNLQFNSGYGSVATAFGCRAWVNFNGTGTVAIRASGNVSSITDNGTGIYTVNFTTAMPDANYGASVSVSSMPAVSDANMVSTDANNTSRTNPTTSAFRITTFNAQFQPLDIEFVRVTIFR